MINRRKDLGKRQRKSRRKAPRIYLNFNSRLKTMTFRPTNPTITNSELSRIQSTNKQPRHFSMAIYMTDVIRILLHEDHRIHLHYKVAKYLLVHDKFRLTLLKEIESNHSMVEECTGKASRARKSSSRKNWEIKANEYAEEWNKLCDLKEILQELVKIK